MRYPELRHVSREDAEAWFSAHPYVVISLVDPGSAPVEFVADENRLATLRMEFHDLDHAPDGMNGKDIVLYSDAHAKQILAFVETWRDKVEVILVHCEAGISRSAGLVAALAVRFQSRRFKPRKGVPNRRVYLTTVRA